MAPEREKAIPAALAAAALLAAAGAAHAQSATVFNPSFEDADGAATNALGWREFLPARRRTTGDALAPAALVRTGAASMELPAGAVFSGFDTNEFNLSTFLWNDLAYGYGCGPAVFRAWYAIPASNPLEFQPAGLKMEFRRDNQSVYLPFENLFIRPASEGGTGHTNDMFVQGEFVVWPSQFDFIHLYNNMGSTYGSFPSQAPTRVSLLPFRFGNVPQGETENGVIFWDDVSFVQDTTGAEFPEYIVFDDQEVSLRAVLDQGGVTEPAVPVHFTGDSTIYDNGDQVGFGCIPSDDVFDAINVIDRVPGTTEYPQTFADIVANGFVRAVHQNADGSSGTFGTSVITAPSFRPQGGVLDLIPDISRADIDLTYNFPMYEDDGMGGMVPAEPPLRSDFTISTTGDYGAAATVTSTRDYSADPVVGTTTFTVDFTFEALQNIDLDTARSVGNDAFRLITLSSMFASRATGEYDASSLEVEEAGGGTTQLVLTDATPRDDFLFIAPVETTVGNTFTLLQDDQATFNPDSPTIAVTIDSLTGVVGRVGVQGFLAASTDPNDDSLSVWLEWIDAPATITSGTTISGSFTVTATPPGAAPTPDCPGDIDGNGSTDVFDFAELASNFGAGPGATRAEGDLTGDGFVDVFDFGELAADFGCPN